MAERWAYFCADCEFTSGIRFPDPLDARRAFRDSCKELRRVRQSQALRTPTQELAALFFVAEHAEHQVWLASEVGWLRLFPPSSDGDETSEDEDSSWDGDETA